MNLIKKINSRKDIMAIDANLSKFKFNTSIVSD